MLCPICNNLEPIVISIIRLTKTLDCLQRQTSPQAKLYGSYLPSLFGHFWFSGALDGAKQTHKHVSHWLSKQSNYFQCCPVLWLPSQDLHSPPFHTSHRPRQKLPSPPGSTTTSGRRGRVKKMRPRMRFQK